MLVLGVDSSVLGQCPAAVVVQKGRSAVVLVNGTAFARLTPFEKRFILAHEMGHYLLSTSNELLADAFALGMTAGTEHASLKKSLRTLLRLDIPAYRFDSLCRLTMWRDRK